MSDIGDMSGYGVINFLSGFDLPNSLIDLAVQFALIGSVPEGNEQAVSIISILPQGQVGIIIRAKTKFVFIYATSPTRQYCGIL